MEGLRERIRDRRNVLVSQSKSCIPKMVSDETFKYAQKIFQNSLTNRPLVDKVSIIDPYILPIDLDNLTSLFGGSVNINLQIISKFKSAKSDDEKKQERKIKLIDRKKYLVKNGLFKDIDLIHTEEPMHDRYYIFWNEDVMVRVFCVGGSINQRFNDYISIIEISDKFLLSNIYSYYVRLVDNRIEFLKV